MSTCANTSIGRTIDIEDVIAKGERLKTLVLERPSLEDARRIRPLIDLMIARIKEPGLFHDQEWLKSCFRKFKFNKKNSYLLQSYRELVHAGDLQESPDIDDGMRLLMQIKAGKSSSGVVVITIFTSGTPTYVNPKTGKTETQNYSCGAKCSFCATEPPSISPITGDLIQNPKSYYTMEPGVLRANRNGFDCKRQMYDRMIALYDIGHNIDKLEILISGATFSHYPNIYRNDFIRDAFYAASTFWDYMRELKKLGSHEEALQMLRPPSSIDDEHSINKTARTKVIGVTVETRPDTITPREIRLLRKWGVTRVQLGVQHIDDEVLSKNFRDCPTQRTAQAIKMLKDCNFKIDLHWMTNMPFSTYEMDRDMLVNKVFGLKKKPDSRFINNELHETYELSMPDIFCDQAKIYPTMITPWTQIEKWYKDGSYVPYSDELTKQLLYDMMTQCEALRMVRLSRIVRDINSEYLLTHNDGSMLSWRSEVEKKIKLDGKTCRCIRCREIKTNHWNGDYQVVVRKYHSADGIEYFISAESFDTNVIYGFVRLRIPSSKFNEVFDELWFCSLLREAHVYGTVQVVDKGFNSYNCNVQHRGIGKRLIAVAERISKENGYYKMSVISGIGAQVYYEKLGFKLDLGDGKFMIKDLV